MLLPPLTIFEPSREKAILVIVPMPLSLISPFEVSESAGKKRGESEKNIMTKARRTPVSHTCMIVEPKGEEGPPPTMLKPSGEKATLFTNIIPVSLIVPFKVSESAGKKSVVRARETPWQLK